MNVELWEALKKLVRRFSGNISFVGFIDSDGQPQIVSATKPLPGTAVVSGSVTVGDITVLHSALPDGAATDTSVVAVGDKIPVLGQALAALSLPVTLTALEEGLFGELTETAPASDTASSGLNGRLQRIAQRLSSLIALLPTALGQGTMATSLKVVLPSDQSSIPVAATLGSETTKVIGTVNIAASQSVGLQRQLPAPSATITRPATTPTYGVGAAIGDVSGTAIIAFPNIVRSAGEVMLTSITLELDVASSAIGAMTLHLFNSSPTSIADTDVWSFPSSDRGKWVADVQLVAPTDKGSTLVSSNDQINKQITMTETTLYGILTTDTSFTATASTVKVVTPHLAEM